MVNLVGMMILIFQKFKNLIMKEINKHMNLEWGQVKLTAEINSKDFNL